MDVYIIQTLTNSFIAEIDENEVIDFYGNSNTKNYTNLSDPLLLFEYKQPTGTSVVDFEVCAKCFSSHTIQMANSMIMYKIGRAHV